MSLFCARTCTSAKWQRQRDEGGTASKVEGTGCWAHERTQEEDNQRRHTRDDGASRTEAFERFGKRARGRTRAAESDHLHPRQRCTVARIGAAPVEERPNRLNEIRARPFCSRPGSPRI